MRNGNPSLEGKNSALCSIGGSRDSALCCIAWSQFSLKKKKILSATPRYATQCEIQVKNFLVNSALCGTAGSRLRAMQHSGEPWLRAMRHSTELWLRAMWHSAESRLPTMRHSAEPIFVVEFSWRSPRIRIYMLNRLAHESGDPGVQFNEKNRGLKISWHCPFKYGNYININEWHYIHPLTKDYSTILTLNNYFFKRSIVSFIDWFLLCGIQLTLVQWF
jgi:hypothetical protein